MSVHYVSICLSIHQCLIIIFLFDHIYLSIYLSMIIIYLSINLSIGVWSNQSIYSWSTLITPWLLTTQHFLLLPHCWLRRVYCRLLQLKRLRAETNKVDGHLCQFIHDLSVEREVGKGISSSWVNNIDLIVIAAFLHRQTNKWKNYIYSLHKWLKLDDPLIRWDRILSVFHGVVDVFCQGSSHNFLLAFHSFFKKNTISIIWLNKKNDV